LPLTARAAAHQRLLFSRRRLRETVRSPVSRSGGSSLAASCQPHAAPAPAQDAFCSHCCLALRQSGPCCGKRAAMAADSHCRKGLAPL